MLPGIARYRYEEWIASEVMILRDAMVQYQLIMNIALLGGRFDPPHNGHLHIAKYILEADKNIDEVWLVPANTHPWRPIIASAEDRIYMTSLLANKNIKVTNIDIQRGGDTYTIDTVTQLQQERTDTFFWVCGSDQLPDLKRWKKFTLLQQLIHFLVIPRQDNSYDMLPKNASLVTKNYIPVAVSSSLIRDRIKQNLPITSLVPLVVEEYIKERKLYL